MTVSIFTPIHRPEWSVIERCIRSVKSQNIAPDQWVICLNGDMNNDQAERTLLGMLPGYCHVFRSDNAGNVGALKAECCNAATGDIMVELDYDDELTPDAVQEIRKALNPEHRVFAYSNFVEVKPDGSPHVYGGYYGWQSRPYADSMIQMVAFPEQAQYMRRIEWAPNHVRAWKADAYRAIGGHDTGLHVGDDHDLVMRFYRQYGERGFVHIDKCLYIYHRHDDNTSIGKRNAEIQAQVDRNYCLHAEAMYKRWATDNGLLCLDLGGRFNCPDGYQSVDLYEPADHIADLNQVWPFADDSVGVIRAYHVVEHMNDTVHFFNEAFRVLAPGGFLLIEVPSVTGLNAAFGDPTHKRFFTQHSFDYFTNEQFCKFIRPQYVGEFQEVRKTEYLWFNPERWIISVHMIALKGFYKNRPCGK